jgi:stress-induced morphogen
MALEQSKLEELIKQAFPEAEIEITDLVGDNNHYQLSIKDACFEDKGKVAQHRLVNEALKQYLGDELHALSIKTKAK